MTRICAYLISAILLFAVVSCSGSSSPVQPDPMQQPDITAARSTHASASTHLWGLWDVWADPSTGRIEAVPLRGAAFTANVIKFVDGPPSNLLISIFSLESAPDYTDITVDVGIKHPFPGLDKYTGFDVVGVFMGNGGDAYPGPGGFNIPGENDQRLLNPDGYTRWFNATEFEGAGSIQPLLGYKPGKAGSPGFFPTAELSGYKYFADKLTKHQEAFNFLTVNAPDRGCFRPGNVNYRRYQLRFPKTSGIKFQYAVIAHWEDPGVDNPVLEDFPLSANADEALLIDIDDSSTLYYVDSTTKGGYIDIDVSPWDWSAATSDVMQEYTIKVYSNAWGGACDVDMTPVATDQYHYTFHAFVSDVNLASANPLPIWVEVIYPDLDYSNKFGVPNNADGNLTSYFRYEVPVSDTVQPYFELEIPNGGQKWAPGTSHPVKWTSNDVPGTVFLQYSKDNFVTDVHTIGADKPNTGHFIWDNIPNDPSNTVKVRVGSTLDPTVYDDSDNYFTILTPDEPWINVIQPNGGEEWEVASKHWVFWSSNDVPGNVKIEYSKDGFNSDINVIAADEINDGSFLWNPIPDDVSDTCQVRITAVDDPLVWNISDDWWSIVPPGNPWIEVLIPNGGQAWVAGSQHEITWDWYNLGGNVKIEYSKDDFASPAISIVASTENDGSYMWNPIPNDPSTTVKVRITSVDIPTVNDKSDGYFSILAPLSPWFEILVPNGGQQWMVGTAHEILWTSGNVTGNVDLLYSKDGFGTDIHTIAGDINNTGSFMWNPVPNDPSTTVRVRVRSHTTTTIYDDSDSNFAIMIQGGGWARHWGWQQSDYGYGVCSDGAANVYVTGSFEGTVDFDPGGPNDPKVPNGPYDAFLSKFDKDGNYQWARTWGGSDTSNRDTGYGVVADSLGNVFVCGIFYGAADFDPGGGTDMHTPTGGSDAFLVKYNSYGDYQWGLSWGGTGYENAYAIGADSYGDVYVAGEFSYTVDFDPDPVDETTRTPNPYYWPDSYLVKFDNNGDFKWVISWGGTLYYDKPNGLAVDPSDNVWVCGYFAGPNCDFDPGGGTNIHDSNGGLDAFLAKYDSAGNHLWAGTWGAGSDDAANGVAVDGNGNAYVTGYYQWDVDFDPGSGVYKPGYFWYRDIFLSKFNSSGGLQWAKVWGSNNDYEYGWHVGSDDVGNVFVVHEINGTADIDPGGAVDNRNTGRYLSRFNTNGDYQWGHLISTYYITVNSIWIDPDQNLLFTGTFQGNRDFDPGPLTDYHQSNSNSQDAFAWKLMSDGYY